MRHRGRRCLAWIGAFLGGLTLSAGEAADESRARADLVVRGRVLSLTCERRPTGHLVTRVEVQVSDVREGHHPGPTLTVTQYGGTLGSLEVAASDLPTYHPGEDVVLFLRRNDAGEAIPVGPGCAHDPLHEPRLGARVGDPQRVAREPAWPSAGRSSGPNGLRLTEPRSGTAVFMGAEQFKKEQDASPATFGPEAADVASRTRRAGLAAVFGTDAADTVRRWNLVNPETTVGNPLQGKVSTNVVNPWTRAVRYFLAADGYSTTNTTAELNAVRDAFAVWQAAPNTILKFEEGGTLPPGVDVDELDGTNVVFWVKNGTRVAGGTFDIGLNLAVTFTASYAGRLLGADLVLNGDAARGRYWYTHPAFQPPSDRYRFIEAAVTHELGHFVGLEHSPLGGSTLFYRDPGGVGPWVGLSSDERLGLQFLYPQAGLLTGRGTIAGKVTRQGAPVLGAVVVAEDPAGNAVASALTRANGDYALPALPPGTYQVRVTPLDSRFGTSWLVRGQDIIAPEYTGAETAFLPSAPVPVTVLGGQTHTVNATVAAGTPAFRISGIQRPVTALGGAATTPGNFAAVLRAGQSGWIVGVYSLERISDCTLSIGGDGLTVTPLGHTTVFGHNLLYAEVSVSPNATPGLRSFKLERGTEVAWANGFFEVLPGVSDDNYDGLDDAYQRRYFLPWTGPAAAPRADPDADGFRNDYESMAGSDPTDRHSLPTVELESVRLEATGSTLRWRGVPGGRYRVYSRRAFTPASPWQTVGAVVTAAGYDVEFLDPTAKDQIRFYRVEILPSL